MSNQPGSPWGSHDPQNSWGTQPQPPAPKSPNPWQRLVDFVRASRLNAILAGLVGLLAVMMLILAVVIVVPGGNDDKTSTQASADDSSDDEEKYGGMSEKEFADALGERLDAERGGFANWNLLPEGQPFTIEWYDVATWPSGKEHLTLKGSTEAQFTNARIIDVEKSPREELGQWEVTDKMICYDVSIHHTGQGDGNGVPVLPLPKIILDDERLVDSGGGDRIERRVGWNGPHRIAGGSVVEDESDEVPDRPDDGPIEFTQCYHLDVDIEDWDEVGDSYTGVMIELFFEWKSDTDRLMIGDLNWPEDKIGIPVNLK